MWTLRRYSTHSSAAQQRQESQNVHRSARIQHMSAAKPNILGKDFDIAFNPVFCLGKVSPRRRAAKRTQWHLNCAADSRPSTMARARTSRALVA